jgi:hypothetical protein
MASKIFKENVILSPEGDVIPFNCSFVLEAVYSKISVTISLGNAPSRRIPGAAGRRISMQPDVESPVQPKVESLMQPTVKPPRAA